MKAFRKDVLAKDEVDARAKTLARNEAASALTDEFSLVKPMSAQSVSERRFQVNWMQKKKKKSVNEANQYLLYTL
jgi:hypothetical protein